MSRLVCLLGIAIATLAPARSDACSLAPNASELVPRNGSTGVPQDSLIVFSEWEAQPSAMVVSTGASIALASASLPGALSVKPFRATGGLPPGEEIVLSDGRSFRVGPAEARATIWELEGAKLIEPDSSGCTHNTCDDVRPFRIDLKTVFAGEQPGYFHVYESTIPTPGALPEGPPTTPPLMAFVPPDLSSWNAERLTIFLRPNHKVPVGSKIFLVPVDLEGKEGKALGPMTIAGSPEGCGVATGTPSLALARWSVLAAVVGLLALALVRRGRRLT